ncbi:uncharacterized protein LOC113462064 [Phoenix dactylifera]|uniref:Uncharacterized protein LOC113462064 n=1 Tax=Phoenix dactylifera TaxID=42345 RepID=A0A8B8Z9S0_PHODC|nr:uncharacterized protein LOC113462064 [Phoenix dactylifera]
MARDDVIHRRGRLWPKTTRIHVVRTQIHYKKQAGHSPPHSASRSQALAPLLLPPLRRRTAHPCPLRRRATSDGKVFSSSLLSDDERPTLVLSDAERRPTVSSAPPSSSPAFYCRWEADVVGGSGQGGEEEERLPVVFTPEQQQYALELDQKAASLRRSIQDLRLRIPPAHISQRLPHLHAHTLASNAALALQLNSHSTTQEQAQLRATTLQEENAAYEKAISNCQKKIQEKLHEADLLQSKLREMDLIEKDLKAELERALAAKEIDQPEALKFSRAPDNIKFPYCTNS